MPTLDTTKIHSLKDAVFMATIRPDNEPVSLWGKLKAILESAILLWTIMGVLFGWVLKNELRISHLEWDSAQFQQQLNKIDIGQAKLQQDVAEIKGDIRYIRGLMERSTSASRQ